MVAALEALRDLDEARARLYLDLGFEPLGPLARSDLENVMLPNWQPRGDAVSLDA